MRALKKDSAKKIKLISTDLDGTLISKENPSCRFKKYWYAIPHDQRPLLCYNTGRSRNQVDTAIAKYDLPIPDYLIASVGTRCFIYERGIATEILSFRNKLSTGWDRTAVVEILDDIKGIGCQPEQFQNTHKSSWYIKEEPATKLVNQIRTKMRQKNIKFTLVYSSGCYLDILPCRAGKGSALKWLMRELNILDEEVIVAGNTGNDSSMFLIDGVERIAVANAKPELWKAIGDRSVFECTRRTADGVIEGLEHFRNQSMRKSFSYPINH